MPNFDYHQGRIQPYSVEPSDHRLYVAKKIILKNFNKKNCFYTMISHRYLEETVNYFGR